jgi:4-aminobutyrate aminotransferase-like enzyme
MSLIEGRKMSAIYEREMKKFLQKTKRSEQIYKKSAEVTPFGVHSNYRSMEPYPIYFTKGKGSRLWDVDGNATWLSVSWLLATLILCW